MTGERYYTHRLVKSTRVGGKVKQTTLLNLGRHFSIAQEYWPLLCIGIDRLLSGQAALLPVDCPAAVERETQRCAAQLLARQESVASPADASAPPVDMHNVDVESLELTRPRSVGVESVGLWSMQQVEFSKLLESLGVSGTLRSAAIASIIGRLAKPASERATYTWLGRHSGLGELLDVDFETLSSMTLYRASDALIKHRESLEKYLFSRVSELFGLATTVTLYDLTNTYMEGQAVDNPKAEPGWSKEKRKDCPLVTLALVLDGSGFVRHSKTFEGNVSEGDTLERMLDDLNTPKGAMIVMDRGLSCEDNLRWLRGNGYRYLVVSREHTRQFDAKAAIAIENAAGETVRLSKTVDEKGEEVRLYCHSQGREKKERAIVKRFVERFEAGLQKIHDGLSKPRCEKRIDKLWERIGRLKEKSHGMGQRYHIEMTSDRGGKRATAIAWEQGPVGGT
ncbi:MAG: transposase, partial [Rhodobacteraceae bacterium]|nr:transposase [Paracoccaceae bacterium]